MSSREVLSEATRWLVELEAAERLEDVWPEFDDWFQASAAHRAAYEKVRSVWASVGHPTRCVQTRSLRHQRRWFRSHHWVYAQAWLSCWWPLLAALALTIFLCCAYSP